MKHLSNDHKEHSNQHKNGHMVCSETGHPVLSLLETETETTLRSEFPNGGKAIVEQILASEEINPKEQGCENHSQGFK